MATEGSNKEWDEVMLWALAEKLSERMDVIRQEKQDQRQDRLNERVGDLVQRMIALDQSGRGMRVDQPTPIIYHDSNVIPFPTRER